MLLGILIICLMWCVPAISANLGLAIFGTVVGVLSIMKSCLDVFQAFSIED